MSHASPTKRKETQARTKRLFVDGFGVAFGDQKRYLLGASTKWNLVYPTHDIDDPRQLMLMHEAWANLRYKNLGTCWMCGKSRELECHHIISRAQGGTDSRYNLAMLCGMKYQDSCHTWAQDNKEAYPAVLLAKWENDWLNCSWVFLSRLYGKHFTFLELKTRAEIEGR